MTSKVAPIQEELEEEASPPFCNLYNALSSVLFACSGSSSDYFPCCKPFSNSTSVSVPESSTVAEHDCVQKVSSGKKTSTFIAKASSPPSKDTNKCISEQESDFSITPHKVPVTRNHVHVEEIAKHQVCSSSNRSTAKSQGNTSHSKSTPTASLQQIPFTVNQNGNEYNGASTSIGLSPTDFSHVYANFRPSTPMLAYSTPTNCEETTAMSTPNTIPFFFQQQNINNTINVCSEPIASIYKVRGPTYFQNGIKLPSQESILALVRVESYVVVNPTKPYPSKNNDTRKDNDHSSKNFLCLWKQQLDPHHPFLLIVNWILPWGSLKSYFCQMNDCHNKSNPAHQLWNRFATQMTNEERNDRLKLIPHIVNGPWIIKKMVGATPNKPVILGKNDPDFLTYNTTMTTKEEKMLEICIHVSEKAPTIANACKNASDSLTVDLALVIEAKTTHELPEQVLCTVRLHRISMTATSISCCKSC